MDSLEAARTLSGCSESCMGCLGGRGTLSGNGRGFSKDGWGTGGGR